jgi:hypothetical protein
MWVEVVKSIARYPARSIAGAMVSVLAVVTPSAPHRHWLPSRRLVSTIWRLAIRSARRRPNAQPQNRHSELVSGSIVPLDPKRAVEHPPSG